MDGPWFGASQPAKPAAAAVRSTAKRVSLPGNNLQTTSSTWESVVASAESATKRVSQMFVVAEDAAAVPEGGIYERLANFWQDTTEYIGEAANTVNVKIAELQTPEPVPDDPLKALRADCGLYVEALELLKAEILNFSVLVDSLRRSGTNADLSEETPVDLFEEKLKELKDNKLSSQYRIYLKTQREYANRQDLREVRRSIELLVSDIGEEIAKIQSLFTRFRKRDRLYQTGVEIKNRLEKKKEKHRGASRASYVPDPKIMQELFELNTSIEENRREYNVATRTLILKCNEILTIKGKTMQEFIARLVESQRISFLSTETFARALSTLFEQIKKAPILPDAPFVHQTGLASDEGEASEEASEPTPTAARKASSPFLLKN